MTRRPNRHTIETLGWCPRDTDRRSGAADDVATRKLRQLRQRASDASASAAVAKSVAANRVSGRSGSDTQAGRGGGGAQCKSVSADGWRRGRAGVRGGATACIGVCVGACDRPHEAITSTNGGVGERHMIRPATAARMRTRCKDRHGRTGRGGVGHWGRVRHFAYPVGLAESGVRSSE